MAPEARRLSAETVFDVNWIKLLGVAMMAAALIASPATAYADDPAPSPPGEPLPMPLPPGSQGVPPGVEVYCPLGRIRRGKPAGQPPPATGRSKVLLATSPSSSVTYWQPNAGRIGYPRAHHCGPHLVAESRNWMPTGRAAGDLGAVRGSETVYANHTIRLLTAITATFRA
jgi:hypothetical protein